MRIDSVVVNPPQKGIYISVKSELDHIYLDIGNCYLEFTKINQDTFQLVKSHSVDSQDLHPVVSWSGVLWHRREALEANQSLIAYLQDLGRID